MIAELESGKEVQGCNSGRGLEGAAYAANCGDLGSRRSPNHLHVYLGTGEFTFICSAKPLTVDELGEADAALAGAKNERVQEIAKLRSKLLGAEGDALLAERQNGNLDSQTASRDIVQALLPEIPIRSNKGTWSDVKRAIECQREVVNEPQH